MALNLLFALMGFASPDMLGWQLIGERTLTSTTVTTNSPYYQYNSGTMLVSHTKTVLGADINEIPWPNHLKPLGSDTVQTRVYYGTGQYAGALLGPGEIFKLYVEYTHEDAVQSWMVPATQGGGRASRTRDWNVFLQTRQEIR